MKKLTKILSCLTAAAIICSAGALSACSSGDETGDNTGDNAENKIVSDVVTEDEWNAAFADENFYNVIIDFTQNNNGESNGIVYDSENNVEYYNTIKLSGDYNYTFKYDLTSADEILLGNVYCCENGNYENLYEYQNEVYPEYSTDEEEAHEYTDFEYYLYGEQGYDYAKKSVNDGEDGKWYTYSSSNPLYAERFSFDTVDYGRTILLSDFGYLDFEYFEYKDGAYVYSFENYSRSYIPTELVESGLEYEVTEFTGGVLTYSVIIKDGKVYSIKYNYSYTIGYNFYLEARYNVCNESNNVTCKWTFSDYGTTTVTVPDEVSVLFE